MDFDILVPTGFGWLLGLLAPAITRRIGKDYRKSELRTAIKTELEELAYKLIVVAFHIREIQGELPNEFLDVLD